MLVYPVSTVEDRVIRWAAVLIPAGSAVIIAILGALSVAST